MADADVIAQAAIELTADGRAVIESIDETFRHVREQADEFSSYFARKMMEGLEGMSDETFGEFIATGAAHAGQSLDEFTKNLADMDVALGRSREEAVAAGNAYRENLGERLVETAEMAIFEMKTLGAVTPETAKELISLADAAQQVAQGSESLTEKLRIMSPVIESVRSGSSVMKQELNFVGRAFEKLGIPMSDATKQGQFVSQMLGKVGLGFASAGTAALASFAAFKIFGETKKIFEDAVAIGIKMSEVNFRLEVAVRASQRAIGDQAFSIAEAKAQAQELSEVYGQSIVSMTDLVGTAVRTTSELGLNKEQIKDLTKAAVVMNETMGIDSKSALMQITMFMQSGYGRALSRNGFAVTRAAQQQQAYAMGIRKSLKDMTEAEKQAVRYALVMRQVDKYSEDAAAGQDNLAKKIAHSKQAAEEATKALGDLVAPMKVKVDVFLEDMKTRVVQGITGITGFLTMALAGWAGALATLAAMVAMALKGEFRSIDFWVQERRKAVVAAFKDMTAGVDTLGDAMKNAAEGTDEWQQAIDDALTEIEPDLQQFVDDFLEAKDKLQKEFDEDFAKTFEDTAKDIAKADLESQRDLRDIDEAAYEDRLQTTFEYQKDELRAAQDHKRSMRDLETQYLFDLQDAVRERDARQVLLLQRRYNMEKVKAEEEYRLNAERRKQDYQDELNDIERQRLRKRAERLRAFQEERADLLAQGEERRAQLKAEFAKDEAALRDTMVKGITDAILALVKSGVLSPQQAMALGQQWGATLGGAAGYAIASAVNSALSATLTNAANAIKAFYGGIGGNVGSNTWSGGIAGGGAGKYAPYTSPGSQKRIHGFQTGGDFIATSPQTIQVGERPERVSIQPLNRATGEAAGNMGRGGGRGGGGGKVEVAIALSEGLEGNIVDQAMAEVADVFVTLNRGDAARGAGGRR